MPRVRAEGPQGRMNNQLRLHLKSGWVRTCTHAPLRPNQLLRTRLILKPAHNIIHLCRDRSVRNIISGAGIPSLPKESGRYKQYILVTLDFVFKSQIRIRSNQMSSCVTALQKLAQIETFELDAPVGVRTSGAAAPVSTLMRTRTTTPDPNLSLQA